MSLRFANYQQAYRQAKRYLQLTEGFEKHCKDGTPPSPMPRASGGSYWMVDCDSFEGAGKEARRLVREIENDCMAHAKRLRIPPGRARLR